MRIKLQTKIRLLVLSIVLLFAPLIFLYFPSKEKALLEVNYNQEAQNISNTVALGVRIALVEQNFEGVQTAMSYAKSHPAIEFVALVQLDTIYNEGHRTFTVERSVINIYPENYKLDPGIKSSEKLIVKNAYFNTSVLKGEVLAGFSTLPIERDIARMQRTTVLGSILISLFLLVTGFWFARSISSPVLQLNRATQRVARGERGFKIESDSRDEIGDLVRSFNKMVQRLDQAEQELIEKNKELERLSLVARETGNSVLVLDSNGKPEWANASYEKLNKLTLKELIAIKGETIYELSNNPEIRSIIQSCIDQKKPVVYESLNRRFDGELIWEQSTMTPIFDDSGELKKLIIIDTDVTPQKTAEELIKKKNKDITDSINYAKRIQQAIMPDVHIIQKYLKDSFVLFRPKDIVSGDFYFFDHVWREGREYAIIAAVDCTGHGVPGAFMSIVGFNLLTQAVSEHKKIRPSEILDDVNRELWQTLHQTEAHQIRDGMDIALAVINLSDEILEYAGAFNPLWMVTEAPVNQEVLVDSSVLSQNEHKRELISTHGKSMLEYKADKMPLGDDPSGLRQYRNHKVKINKGDTFYLFTDGFADQFGGNEAKKFKRKQFQNLLYSIQDQSMIQQMASIDKALNNWRGNLEQVDDILVIGFRF